MAGERKEVRLSHSWRIPKSWSELKDKSVLVSEPFFSGSDPDVGWTLRFYRRSRNGRIPDLAPQAFLAKTVKTELLAEWTLTWLFSSTQAKSAEMDVSNRHPFETEDMNGKGHPLKADLERVKWEDGTLMLRIDLRYWRPARERPSALPELLPSRMARLLFSEEFSDFTVRVHTPQGTTSIPAHKLVLLGHSDVLGRMLGQEGMAEARTSSLLIEDFEEASVRAFLRFLYTGQTALQGRCEELLALADKYDVAPLKAACEQHLGKGLSTETVCALAGLAEARNAEGLLEACVSFAAKAGALPRQPWLRLLRRRPAAAARLAEAFVLFHNESSEDGQPLAKKAKAAAGASTS